MILKFKWGSNAILSDCKKFNSTFSQPMHEPPFFQTLQHFPMQHQDDIPIFLTLLISLFHLFIEYVMWILICSMFSDALPPFLQNHNWIIGFWQKFSTITLAWNRKPKTESILNLYMLSVYHTMKHRIFNWNVTGAIANKMNCKTYQFISAFVRPILVLKKKMKEKQLIWLFSFSLGKWTINSWSHCKSRPSTDRANANKSECSYQSEANKRKRASFIARRFSQSIRH